MSDNEKTIESVLNSFETLAEPFDEYQVNSAVNAFIKEEKNEEDIPLNWLAEVMAFGFHQNYQHQETGWGTYYGPMWVKPNQDGTATEAPSIKLVTPEMIEYWTKRAEAAKHPILKLRYADLVWDFSEKICKKKPHYTMAHIVIDSTVEIAKQNCHKYEVDIITKLERALSLVLSINDKKRLESLVETIVLFEDSIADDSKLGLWGFSYDLLIENNKIKLLSVIEEKIMHDLEERLSRVSDPSEKTTFNPWAVESAARRLASFYRSKNENENARRVLLKFGAAFDEAVKNGSALQASAWLQKVHSVYLDYGLRAEADQVANKLRDIGSKVNDEMKPISQEITVPKEEMDAYMESMVKGDIDTVFVRIAIQFVPKRDQIENQLNELSQKNPLSYHIPKQIQDDKGRPISSIGPLKDDLEGNVVHLASQNMAISAMFLRPVMKALISRFELTPQKIVDHLYKSPVFDEDKKEIILSGIKAYFEDNHLVSIHLLIPQIESVVRNIVERTGGSVLKPSRTGGLQLKTLDELLRNDKFVEVLGDDIALYLRILLTDQRGWNLRNDVCHGLSPASVFQVNLSDRLVHAILCLALVREKTESQNDKEKA